MFLNLLIDLYPRNNGIITAWICTRNKIEKNKLIFKPQLKAIYIRNIVFNYLEREKYHRKNTIISIVKTNGKAGYRVWKSAGGQGDQDISLPLGLFDTFKIFSFCGGDASVANPLLILKTKLNNNKNKKKVKLCD